MGRGSRADSGDFCKGPDLGVVVYTLRANFPAVYSAGRRIELGLIGVASVGRSEDPEMVRITG